MGQHSRGFSSWGLALLPLVLMLFTHLSLPPLQELFELSRGLLIGYYLIGIACSYAIVRKSRIVKDHEYNRVKAMKKMKQVYMAEASGVWEQSDTLNQTIDTSLNTSMNTKVDGISFEPPELELGEHEVEVTMLNETAHVVKANQRMKGDDTFDEQSSFGSFGAKRQVGFMDRFIDSIGRLFGKDLHQRRESARIQRLMAASQQAPVFAQRPVAPLKIGQQEPQSVDDMTTMSDFGGIKTHINAVGLEVESSSMDSHRDVGVSIESMAMIGHQPPMNVGKSLQPTCSLCQFPVNNGERFCSNCGQPT